MGGLRDEIYERDGRSRGLCCLWVHDRRNDGRVLEQCGDDLSRENISRQALAIKDLELPMLLAGIEINTAPENYFLIRQMQLARFNGEIWEPFGDLISG